jgi:hypothetical protein
MAVGSMPYLTNMKKQEKKRTSFPVVLLLENFIFFFS